MSVFYGLAQFDSRFLLIKENVVNFIVMYCFAKIVNNIGVKYC